MSSSTTTPTRLWVERQDCLMMICCLSTSAAHHLRPQSQCLLFIRRDCPYCCPGRTTAAWWNLYALTWTFISAHCTPVAPACQSPAIPNATRNKEMYQSSNCFLDVGFKPFVDARTKICTLATAIGTPTLLTCSDILLLGCMTAMLTTSLLKLLRELRAVLTSVAYQRSPHALILPNSHRKVGFPNRLLNHSPTTWLYIKRNARLGRTSCFQIIMSPHFRQSAMISLYESVKLESYI
jgi:hypothetical protein